MTTEPVSSNEPRVDSERVLRIIQECLNEMNKCSPPITSDTAVHAYFLQNMGHADLEYLDLEFRLYAKLGVRLTRGDWNFLSGSTFCKTIEEWEIKYAPLFTFGRLAELIARTR